MKTRGISFVHLCLPTLALIVLFIALACAQKSDAGKPQSRKVASMPGFFPADGAVTDQTTGLPTRIVHKASGIVLVLIPSGEFLMGSPIGEPERSNAERQHRRVIRKPFYIGETEVTVGQFRKFAQATGYQTDAERGTPEDSHGKGAFATTPDGIPTPREWSTTASWQNPFPSLKDYCLQDNHPVVQVSWNDAQRFCEQFGFQLPTEAQWEYACRAGSRERFFWGDSIDGGKGYGNLNDTSYRKRFPYISSGFPFDDGAALLSAVGSYKPNAWGLRDMIGNVVEWCQDTYQKYPEDGADETAAPGVGGVLRGGSWLDHPFLCRSAKRASVFPQGRRDFIGFRVAMKTSE
jgi:formylglycine-generating enzyme required for sulfatase activity